MNNIKKNEQARHDFVLGVLAVAQSKGISKSAVKQKCFSSYATGNRRIEHHPEELTLVDLFNIALLCGMSPAVFLQKAAENINFKF